MDLCPQIDGLNESWRISLKANEGTWIPGFSGGEALQQRFQGSRRVLITPLIFPVLDFSGQTAARAYTVVLKESFKSLSDHHSPLCALLLHQIAPRSFQVLSSWAYSTVVVFWAVDRVDRGPHRFAPSAHSPDRGERSSGILFLCHRPRLHGPQDCHRAQAAGVELPVVSGTSLGSVAQVGKCR